MTIFEYEVLCGKYLINPEIALENENFRNALKNRDYKKVEEILINEF
tara:strand:- start:251 stop:391 length:141 start_codon:yes stop_codon:yes gene_type:complete